MRDPEIAVLEAEPVQALRSKPLAIVLFMYDHQDSGDHEEDSEHSDAEGPRILHESSSDSIE